jgi:hypothetical protein
MAEEFDTDAANAFRDMDNNGIPDYQQPNMQPQVDQGYQHQDSYEVGRDNVSGAAYGRELRNATAHYAATIDTAEAGSSDGPRTERVNAQNAAARQVEQKMDSDPGAAIKRPNFEKTVHDIDVLRKKEAARKKKTKFTDAIGSAQNPKQDKAHGAEILTMLFSGLKSGIDHGRARNKEIEHEQNQLEAEAIELRRANSADLDQHENALKVAARDRDEVAKTIDGQAKAPGTYGDDGGPGGSDGGPGGASGGPGGAGPGGETASNDQNDSSRPPEAANDVAPTPQTATSAEAERGRDGLERNPAFQEMEKPIAAEGAKEQTPEAKTPASVGVESGVAGPSQGKEAGSGEALGSAGLGAALTTVNPALGIVATAAKTQESQRSAGSDHVKDTVTGAKGPRNANAPGMPGRPKTTVSFKPGQPTRSLSAVPSAGRARDDAKGVIKVPIKPARMGSMHAQASGLNMPSKPIVSKGTASAGALTRALGIGLGSSLMRVMSPPPVVQRDDGPSLAEQQMRRSQQSGNSR